MEKGEFGEKEELLQRLSKSERECIKLSEEVARLGEAERRYQVRILYRVTHQNGKNLLLT